MNSNGLSKHISDTIDQGIESNALFFDLLGVGQEKNCRYLWVRRETDTFPHVVPEEKHSIRNTWISLGHRRKRKGHISSVDDVLQVMRQDEPPGCTADYFITPNEFFDWRNSNGLSRLCANFIDIDTRGHGILSEREQQIIVREVLETISIKNIPSPTAIVQSGSGGLHLYWMYEPVEAYKWRVERWKAFSEKVICALGSGNLWKVDQQASIDPTRLMRLPGSRHCIAKREVKSYVIDAGKYEFDTLLSSMDIDASRPSPVRLVVNNSSFSDSENRRKSTRTLTSYQQIGKHNIHNWWRNIYLHTQLHCIRNGVGKGKRDYAVFMLFVSRLNQTLDVDKAFQDVKKFNDKFIGLTQFELETYLSTAKKTRYRYKKNTVAKYLEHNLGMDPEFLYTTTKVRLSPVEVKERQKYAAMKTAVKKRDNTLSLLRLAVLSIKQKGIALSPKNIASNCSLSIRTVQRHWRDLDGGYSDIRCASI